mmetsp:Transcript_29309/g.94125  ORF Transcript_29309/g.94125 Transcript_29309/m.94125 type:complete len:179 (-) Transcript_29309:47-583(-)
MGSMRWLTRGRRKAKEIIAKTLEKKSYSSDEVLMQKGGAAEHIYFIEEGTIEVFDDGETLRKELKRGESFGAVELLFGLPTSFTKAAGEAKVWRLPKETMRKISSLQGSKSMNSICKFLNKVSLFNVLVPEEKFSLAKSMEQRTFYHGEEIVREGDVGSEFFLILNGRCNCYKKTLKV